MKYLERKDLLFSLCGLNCGLCSMRAGGFCPGCGGGKGNQPCAVMRCAAERGGIEYCFECADYPCARYDHADDYDSFITHKNQKADMLRAKADFNDGRKKTLYCAAANLLPLPALKTAMERLKTCAENMEIKKKPPKLRSYSPSWQKKAAPN